MPFFKFRRGDAASNPAAGSAVQAQSVEVMRKRAKHRLMGAFALLLLGVMVFPLLFDTQPRPVAVDIPIEIPGKNAVKPLVMPAPAVATAPVSTPASPERVAAAASLSPKEEIFTSKPSSPQVSPASSAVKKEAKAEPKPESRPEPKRDAKVEAKPKPNAESKAVAKVEAKEDAAPEDKPVARPPVKTEVKPAPKPAAPDGDGARATALLNAAGATPAAKPAVTEPKVAASAESKGRMVVQVGAFAESGKADEIRLKLEKAGLKTYTQVAETKDGKRIRVRVGPFASKAEAEKAINKIRSLDLPVAILSF